MRPVIGVTGPDRGGLAAWWFTAFAVRRVVGRSVRIRPGRPPAIHEFAEMVIGGGADVSPSLYGQRQALSVGELADRGATGWRRALGYLLFPLLWLFRRLLTKKQGGLDPARDALALKAVLDANDVLDEITRDGGRQMWDAASWREFQPRLARWMAIFEETGRRHALTAEAGWMLGTEAPGLADLAAWALWSPMTRNLPRLHGMLEREAPAIAGLVARMDETPSLARLREWSDTAWGDSYCGGQIERSLRGVLGRP